MGSRRSCKRRSGLVSIRKCFPFASHRTDCRSRLFFGLEDVQTRHEQPTTGTPVEVPVPRNETFRGERGERRGESKLSGAPLRSPLSALRSERISQRTRTRLSQG